MVEKQAVPPPPRGLGSVCIASSGTSGPIGLGGIPFFFRRLHNSDRWDSLQIHQVVLYTPVGSASVRIQGAPSLLEGLSFIQCYPSGHSPPHPPIPQTRCRCSCGVTCVGQSLWWTSRASQVGTVGSFKLWAPLSGVPPPLHSDWGGPNTQLFFPQPRIPGVHGRLHGEM